MPIFDLIIVFFWLIFFSYWLISAVGVKKNVRTTQWSRSLLGRILLLVIIILVLRSAPASWVFEYQFSPAIQLIGVILCGLGIVFAIWARIHLGRNWSGTPSIKEEHELVTSGPYTFVRHPIYTGMLTAMIGSVLAGGIIWGIVFVVFFIVFLFRIPLEERYMNELFPTQYPEYKKRTKALIPFIW